MSKNIDEARMEEIQARISIWESIALLIKALTKLILEESKKREKEGR